MIYLPSSQYVPLIERKSEIKYQNKVFSIRWRSSSLPITIGSSLPEEFKLPSDWKHSQHISDIHDFFYMKTFCRIVFGSLITWRDQPFEERGCSSVCLTAPVIHSHHEGGDEATSWLWDFYWGGIDTHYIDPLIIANGLIAEIFLKDWIIIYYHSLTLTTSHIAQVTQALKKSSSIFANNKINCYLIYSIL